MKRIKFLSYNCVYHSLKHIFVKYNKVIKRDDLLKDNNIFTYVYPAAKWYTNDILKIDLNDIKINYPYIRENGFGLFRVNKDNISSISVIEKTFLQIKKYKNIIREFYYWAHLIPDNKSYTTLNEVLNKQADYMNNIDENELPKIWGKTVYGHTAFVDLTNYTWSGSNTFMKNFNTLDEIKWNFIMKLKENKLQKITGAGFLARISQ